MWAERCLYPSLVCDKVAPLEGPAAPPLEPRTHSEKVPTYEALHLVDEAS